VSLRLGRWAAACIASVALVAGCTFPPSRVTAVALGDNAGTITGMPASLPAGQYTFKLTAASGSVQLVRLAPGYTVQAALNDAGLAFGDASKPGFKAAAERLYSLAHFLGGVSGVMSFSTYLIPGRYIAVDTNVATPKPVEFTVTPRAVGPNFPAVNVAFGGYMSMSGGQESFGWAVLGRLQRSGTLRFTTLNGDEPHFLVLAKLKAGKTAQQCFSFSGDPSSPASPCSEVLSTSLVSTNEAMTMPYALPGAGNYVIACFVTNPDTGKPHALLGMVRALPPVA
jgi:hypothetical protein